MNEQEREQQEITLVDLLNDPRSSIHDQLRFIEKDPELSGNILGTANSALYGTRRRVTSLRHALVLLGNRKVRELLQTLERKRAVPQEPPREKEMEL
jgi:HD-like signal output (HDOD) protein